MGRLGKLKALITNQPEPSERIDGVFQRVGSEAGLIPLFLDRTTEIRRTEILNIMNLLTRLEFEIIETKTKAAKAGDPDEISLEIKKLEADATFQSYKLARLFQLYFTSGDTWARGLDGELSRVVTAFVELFEDIGHLPSAAPTLRAASHIMLHLSWQDQDVKVMPPTFISTQPILAPAGTRRVDLVDTRSPGTKDERAVDKTENV